MSSTIDCGHRKCDKIAYYFCTTEKKFICSTCMAKLHLKCDVEGIKSKKDLSDLVKYTKKMIKKLKDICDSDIVKLMMENEIKALKTYFFEFQILLSSVKKYNENANWTKLFWSINQLLKEMRNEASYGKIIQFEFEQSIKQEIEEETCASSKKTGNVFSNIVWKMGDECFSISEGINDSVIHSEHTGEHETEADENEIKDNFFCKKSKFAVGPTPTSPEIRVQGSGKPTLFDNFRSKLARIDRNSNHL